MILHLLILSEYSGGHFNPAVSVSVCVSGGLDVILLGPYILSQIVGGMTGAGLAKVRGLSHQVCLERGIFFTLE